MNLAGRNYEEKRNFIRMKVDTLADVRLDPLRQWTGKCHNLSGGGMLISLAEPLPLGMELEVTVSSSHGHNPVLKALTRVCRVNTLKPQECRVGLKILTLLE